MGTPLPRPAGHSLRSSCNLLVAATAVKRGNQMKCSLWADNARRHLTICGLKLRSSCLAWGDIMPLNLDDLNGIWTDGTGTNFQIVVVDTTIVFVKPHDNNNVYVATGTVNGADKGPFGLTYGTITLENDARWGELNIQNYGDNWARQYFLVGRKSPSAPVANCVVFISVDGVYQNYWRRP